MFLVAPVYCMHHSYQVYLPINLLLTPSGPRAKTLAGFSGGAGLRARAAPHRQLARYR